MFEIAVRRPYSFMVIKTFKKKTLQGLFNTLAWDLCPSDYEKMNFCRFKLPSVQYIFLKL